MHLQVTEPTCTDGVKNALEYGVDCGELAGCRKCGSDIVTLPKVCVPAGALVCGVSPTLTLALTPTPRTPAPTPTPTPTPCG